MKRHFRVTKPCYTSLTSLLSLLSLYSFLSANYGTATLGTTVKPQRRVVNPLTKKTAPPTRAQQLACTLHDGLKAKGKYPIEQFSLSKWSKEFHQLLQHRSRDDVTRTMTWFLENIRSPFTPKAHCARTFRLQYAKIEDAMEREVVSGKSKVTISPAGERIVKFIHGEYPEVTSSRSLDQSVERTLLAVEPWFSKFFAYWTALVKDWAKQSKYNTDPCRFIGRGVEMFAVYLGYEDGILVASTPERFARNWWHYVLYERLRWNDWDRDTARDVWSLEHKIFTKWCYRQAWNWGEPDLFDRLLVAIEEHHSKGIR